MYSQFALPQNIVYSQVIHHNDMGWYTTSLFANASHSGAPLFVQLHTNWSVLFSTYQTNDYYQDMIDDLSRVPDSFVPIQYSALHPKTQTLISRIFEIGIADDEIIVQDNDEWWNEIDQIVAQHIQNDINKLLGTVNGIATYQFKNRFLWRTPGSRCVILSRLAIGLIHWDTMNPLDIIQGAPCTIQTADDARLVSHYYNLPTAATTPTPRCPTCSSSNLRKITFGEKAGGFALLGVFSRKVHKQFHCNNCGYEW